MKITNEVIKLDCTKGSYAYAVIDDGVTLIDSSLPGRGEAILSELKTYNINSNDIKRILLTHHDIDHIGSSAYLQEHCGCDILISRTDYPYAMGTEKRHGIKKVLGALMKIDLPKSIKQFDTDKIGNFTIIPTPGHTPGHSCFRFGDVLFVGDLFSSKNGNLTMSPAIMNWNKESLMNSLRNLSTDGVRYLCPAHGEPVSAKDIRSNLNALLNRKGRDI